MNASATLGARPSGHWRPLLVITLVAVIYVALRQLQHHFLDPQPWSDSMNNDLQIYVSSVRAVLDGLLLYDLSPNFTYPPFALLVFAPFAWIPLGLLGPAFQVAKIVALTEGTRRYLQNRVWPDRNCTGWALLAGIVAAALVDSIATDIFDGQVNTALLILVVADLMRPSGSRWRGIGVGIAAGIKVVPGLFIVYLLVSRQFRAAAVAIATFLGTVVLGFLVQPRASWAYWTAEMWDSTRIWPRPDVILNQTVRGVVIRALGHDNRLLWTGLALAVLVVGLVVAAALHRRDRELAALCAVGLTAAAITPQGWIHHWVWFAPTLLILVVGARSSVVAWCGIVLLFYAVNGRHYFLIDDPWGRDALHLSLGEQLVGASNLLGAAAVLLFTALWLHRENARSAPSKELPVTEASAAQR